MTAGIIFLLLLKRQTIRVRRGGRLGRERKDVAASTAEDDATSARTRAIASISSIDASESIDAASSIIAQVRSFIFLL